MRFSLKRIFKIINSNPKYIYIYVKLKNIYNMYSFDGTKFTNLGLFFKKNNYIFKLQTFKKKFKNINTKNLFTEMS